jgi:hypothetical protein
MLEKISAVTLPVKMAMEEESSQTSQEINEISLLDLLAIIFLHCGR